MRDYYAEQIMLLAANEPDERFLKRVYLVLKVNHDEDESKRAALDDAEYYNPYLDEMKAAVIHLVAKSRDVQNVRRVKEIAEILLTQNRGDENA